MEYTIKLTKNETYALRSIVSQAFYHGKEIEKSYHTAPPETIQRMESHFSRLLDQIDQQGQSIATEAFQKALQIYALNLP